MTTPRTLGYAVSLTAALSLFSGPATFAQTSAPGGASTPDASSGTSTTPGMSTGAGTSTMPGMSTGSGMGASSATPSATLNDTDKLFMLRSAQGDMAEISTSQMALKKSKTAQTKQVAQTLIMGHSASLKEGMGLATLLGLPSPKGPTVPDMAFARMLSSANGKDFDKQYLAGQQVDHENTIALYGMELSQGQDPQVKAFAAKYLPGVEGHTALIYQAAMSVGAPDSMLRPTTPPTVTGVAPATMADMSSMSGTSGMSTGSTSGTSGASTGTSGMSGGASTGTSGAGSGASTGTTGTSGGASGTAGSGAGMGAGAAGGAGTPASTPGQ